MTSPPSSKPWLVFDSISWLWGFFLFFFPSGFSFSWGVSACRIADWLKLGEGTIWDAEEKQKSFWILQLVLLLLGTFCYKSHLVWDHGWIKENVLRLSVKEEHTSNHLTRKLRFESYFIMNLCLSVACNGDSVHTASIIRASLKT